MHTLEGEPDAIIDEFEDINDRSSVVIKGSEDINDRSSVVRSSVVSYEDPFADNMGYALEGIPASADYPLEGIPASAGYMLEGNPASAGRPSRTKIN